MDKTSSSRRKGPRTFDRDQAVQTAMRLFWRHGYEGVAISNLTRAIGIAPPSLYAAFGSKEELYRETLDRYTARPGALNGLEPAESLEGAVNGLLRGAVRAATDPDGERGCMISTGLIQCAPEHAGLAADLADRRREMCDRIAEALARWLDPGAANSLARYLIAVMQGLAIQARDGATSPELERIVDEAVAGVSAREHRRAAAAER